MSQEPSKPKCLACDQDSTVTPLIALEYQGERLWICPQHMPVLIHDPTKLVGRLAGAEDLKAADHKD